MLSAFGRRGVAKGYSAPIWMTFKQALELGAHVRKGEHGSLVVFADRFAKTEVSDTGSETERQIPFLKAYTAFNVEQIEGLPTTRWPSPYLIPCSALRMRKRSLARPVPTSAMVATALTTTLAGILCRCRRLKPSGSSELLRNARP
jgi:hypothetical protein